MGSRWEQGGAGYVCMYNKCPRYVFNVQIINFHTFSNPLFPLLLKLLPTPCSRIRVRGVVIMRYGGKQGE